MLLTKKPIFRTCLAGRAIVQRQALFDANTFRYICRFFVADEYESYFSKITRGWLVDPRF